MNEKLAGRKASLVRCGMSCRFSAWIDRIDRDAQGVPWPSFIFSPAPLIRLRPVGPSTADPPPSTGQEFGGVWPFSARSPGSDLRLPFLTEARIVNGPSTRIQPVRMDGRSFFCSLQPTSSARHDARLGIHSCRPK